MRNFYEQNGEFFLNINSYLEEWTKKLDIYSSNGEINKVKLQRLGSLSLNLWNNFNTLRDEKNPVVKDKHYMETHLQGYLASFLLPNIERVFSLLVKDENSLVLKNKLLNTNEEFVLVDFGAGPLSASVGFLCALEFLLKSNPNLTPPKKIKILAIERSEKIFQAGLELIEKSLFDKNDIHIERITSTEKINTSIDFAVCANIFNEIPTKHRLVNLNNIYAKLAFNGSILILEPGQETHAKALSELRNNFLENATDCEIISPCSHKNSCPLSMSSNRSDWCWFRHGWNQPSALKEIDKFSKIDHHFLNFSYLYFMKSKIKIIEPYFARVVSDKLKANLSKKTTLDYFKNNMEQGEKEELLSFAEQPNILKVLLCSQDGSLKSTLLNESDEEEFKRGMRFLRKNTFKYIFNERS